MPVRSSFYPWCDQVLGAPGDVVFGEERLVGVAKFGAAVEAVAVRGVVGSPRVSRRGRSGLARNNAPLEMRSAVPPSMSCSWRGPVGCGAECGLSTNVSR